MDTSCLFAPLHYPLNEVPQTRSACVQNHVHQVNIHQCHHAAYSLFQFTAFVQICRGDEFGGANR